MVQRRTCGWGTALGRGTARGRRDGRRARQQRDGRRARRRGGGFAGGRWTECDSRKKFGCLAVRVGTPSRRLRRAVVHLRLRQKENLYQRSVSGRTGRKNSARFSRSFLRLAEVWHLWCFAAIFASVAFMVLLRLFSPFYVFILFTILWAMLCSSLMRLFLPFASNSLQPPEEACSRASHLGQRR